VSGADLIQSRNCVETEQPMDGVTVNVERCDTGRCGNDNLAIGLGHELANQRRLTRSRLSREEGMTTIAEKRECLPELLG
jgi:hypothetical protein